MADNTITTRPRNGLGTTGFILGLLGALFAWIPFVGVIGWPLAILGLIFSVIGFARTLRGKADNKGLSIAGAVLSVVALIICILYASAFNHAVQTMNSNTGPPAAVDTNRIAAAGQPVRDGAFEFTVTSISSAKMVGPSSFGYTAQGEYKILHVTVRNIGNEPHTLDDSGQVVRDAQGHKFNADGLADMRLNQDANSVWFQSINPGNVVTGQLAFDMPQGNEPVTAEFHDSLFSGGVSVNLR